MVFVRAMVALATVAATIPAPILLLALRSAAVVAFFFFPSFAIFALLWGLLVFLGILGFIPRLHFWCCLFRSACLSSSSLSPPVACIVCFSCWPPSLLVRVWLWGPAWCSFMFGLTFLHLLICFAARRVTNVCVSSLRFGSGFSFMFPFVATSTLLTPCNYFLANFNSGDLLCDGAFLSCGFYFLHLRP